MRASFLLLTILLNLSSAGQQLHFSSPVREEDENINFEILGRADSVYVVYKKVRWKHIITCYDREMRAVAGRRLDFLPEKTFQVDPVLLNGFVFLVYQYQKGSTVYCLGIKTDRSGNKLSDPVLLDTTRVSQLADNKIYATLYSENRQRLMVYKMHLRSGQLTIMGKLYNAELVRLDSSRIVIPFDDRKEFVCDPALANDGSFLFAKQFRERNSEHFRALKLYWKKPGSEGYNIYDAPSDGKFAGDISIKPDNLNGSFLFNAFFFDPEGKNVEGLFSLSLKKDGSLIRSFQPFDDSVRNALDPKARQSQSLNNLSMRDFYLRRNGGFILVAENSFSQGVNSNSNWNRWNYMSNAPYAPLSDYYLYSPYYFGLYRPPGSYPYFQGTRFYSEEILVADLDSALDLKWSTVIRKKQSDDDNENYLSFGNMNMGGELHFLFVEKNGRSSVLNDHSVTPSGKLIRYPPLKSNDRIYSFMPRLAKQVGAREMIIPCVYLGRIIFARLVYDN